MPCVRPFVLFSLLTLAGCGGFGGSTITAAPEDWSKLEGDTVTVRGTAGNTNLGPIVRFEDSGYIPMFTRKPWGIDEVGKRVEVTGKIVNGKGFRAEPYAIDVSGAKLLPPEPPPAAEDPSPEPEPTPPPVAKKKAK